jgi:DNA-binding NarL/FixJ family response regulator
MSSTSTNASQPDLRGTAAYSRNGHDPRRRGAVDLLIVDDNRAAQYSMWALLSWKRDIGVTSTASSSAEAIIAAKRWRPHACLISATLGQGEALTLTSRMKRLSDPPRVLIFADSVDQHLASAATVAGADGVIWRYADPEEQATVVRRAVSGEQQFPHLRPSAINALLDQVEDQDRAIVAMLLEHTPPDHIAGMLGISAHSLELRYQAILKRLGPTCGCDDHRKGRPRPRGQVATVGARGMRPPDEIDASERTTPSTSDHRMPGLPNPWARGGPAPDLREGASAIEPTRRLATAGTNVADIASQFARRSGLPGRTRQAAGQRNLPEQLSGAGGQQRHIKRRPDANRQQRRV